MKTISPPEKDAPTAEPSEARSGALPKRDARRQTTRKTLLAALAGLFVLQGVMHAQTILPQWQKNYSTGKGAGIEANLGADQVILQMFGFREFLAGILWVKADGFFDNGNYDAILPIIRLCTALDPKQIDIYATGMWHIGYNFTDEDQRSDRRYIPSALALGKEGAKQNPNTYEMFFETGWMWYHKIDDDPAQPVEWFEKAHKRPDILPARKNLLAMAYQRNGEVDKALGLYNRLYDEAVKRHDADPAYGNRQIRDTLENNIDTTLVRMVQRGWEAKKANRPLAGYDVYPPFDVGFSVKATVVDPRVVRFEGTWNVLPVGTRIRVVLRDKEYPNGRPAGMEWDQGDSVNLDPPRDKTFMQDQLFVRNRRFNKRIDMSKDVTMYPFISDKYLLEFYYSPRSAPPHIQDKFGWNGEGLTDKHFLRTDLKENQRVIYASFELTRDQILRRGEWADRTPVFRTTNYVDADASSKADVLVDIPSLRSGK